MGRESKLYELSHEERALYRLQVIYSQQTRERQLFMDELKVLRRQTYKATFKEIKRKIGPAWYQVLSEPQRDSLDTLGVSIYQDLLEGRPVRVAAIMRILGILPRPSYTDLENSEHLWNNDPKEMLAQLFIALYGHPIDTKRSSYSYNSRMIMSSILYLGLKDLISLLTDKFRAPDTKPSPPVKNKRKPEESLPSPYLQKIEAPFYVPSKPKPYIPQPLPDLEELNEPMEEFQVPIVYTKPAPLPPPPPPPKKKLPRSYCDKMAGYVTVEPHTSYTAVSVKSVKRSALSAKGSKSIKEVKKTVGVSLTATKKKVRKPKAPSTGEPNVQYIINGVFTVKGRPVYVLGQVSILPAQGDIIHGGFRDMGEGNGCINIHLGIRAFPPPPGPGKCDCVEKWHNDIFDYLKKTKCTCAHYYDYGNEGTFSPEELPFFKKPGKYGSFSFDYDTIFNLDQKSLHIGREFKRIWETESLLQVDDETTVKTDTKKTKLTKKLANVDQKSPQIGKESKKIDETKGLLHVDDKTVKSDTKKTKSANVNQKSPYIGKESKKVTETERHVNKESVKTDRRKSTLAKVSSQDCLGANPKPREYLQCALKRMRHLNVAARLPDIHLVPELIEWMRFRIHGPYTLEEKFQMQLKSERYWAMLDSLSKSIIAHIGPKKEAKYLGHSNWRHKQSLNDDFRKFAEQFKLQLFRAQAKINNMFWPSMYQAETPDKKFREIYFSYLCSRPEEITMMHPYTSYEALDREQTMEKRRYCCPPVAEDEMPDK